MPTLGAPPWPSVPWPTVLLIGGVAAGILLALTSRLIAALGARRRARKADRALRAAVAEVARELVVTPVKGELDRYHRFTAAVHRAARDR